MNFRMKALKNLKIFFLFLTVALSSANIAALPNDWESTKHEHPEAKAVSRNSIVDIKTMPSLLLINVTQTARVEIFTILGRVISDRVLQPGSYEFELPAHGIYIVKVGELTCKVAV